MALSLLYHARIWLQNRFRWGPNAQAIHDGLEESLAEVDTDQATAEARTIVDEADATGLNYWGLDLAEPRLTNQSDDQYGGALSAVYRGEMVDLTSLEAILTKYGVSGVLIDRSSPDVFADVAFADTDAWTVGGPPNYAQFVCLFNAWPGSGSGIPTDSEWDRRCVNAAANLFRIKACGVAFAPFLPVTTPLG